jgi:hypothetical protein
VDANLVRPGPVGVRADVVQELQHGLDVHDPRHVPERHRLGREQAGGEDRQRTVLVAGCLNPAVE